MNITIVGAGRVGIHLAKYFSDEHQDVVLVDSDRNHLSVLESDFNLKTFHGQPIDFRTLREANTENADIFVAVTADTATNLGTWQGIYLLEFREYKSARHIIATITGE